MQYTLHMQRLLHILQCLTGDAVMRYGNLERAPLADAAKGRLHPMYRRAWGSGRRRGGALGGSKCARGALLCALFRARKWVGEGASFSSFAGGSALH